MKVPCLKLWRGDLTWVGLLLLSLVGWLNRPGFASSGTEGAAFLDIPVGAGPAALGNAYTALANDAYAATYNPAALGFLTSTQFSGQHLSYLDTLHSEYMSFAIPLPRGKACSLPGDCAGSALGGSVQYLGTGDVDGMDIDGNPTGSISGYYAAYNLAFGHSFSNTLSLGLTGKLIHAKLAGASASAYAADLGAMYKPQRHVSVAASLTNLGTDLKFLSDGDPLPLAFHLGTGFQATPNWLITTEGVYPKTGLASFRAGLEWHPLELIALRTGYRTDTVKGLSALAGYSLGVGLNVWGQELAYAWLPYGDLGNTHYLSLLVKLGEKVERERNLIHYQHIKLHRTADSSAASDNNPAFEETPEYQQLIEILNHEEDYRANQRGVAAR